MALNVKEGSDEDNVGPGPYRRADTRPLSPEGYRALARQIAAGMTRDLGNLFAAILAQVDLAQGSLEILDIVGVDRDLEDIRLAVLRGSRMVEQMIAFGRGETIGPRTVDLEAVAENAARLVRPLFPQGAVLRLVRDDAPPVRADPGAVEQILVSLALRARDVMPPAGRFTIEVGSAILTRADFARRGWGTPGRYGSITIADNGPALAPEALEHLFETVPTPAEPPTDPGCPLVMAYALMKQHRGFVEVTSEPGRGTRVRLLFRTAPAAAVDRSAGADTPSARSAHRLPGSPSPSLVGPAS